jgi:hypothetical protein
VVTTTSVAEPRQVAVGWCWRGRATERDQHSWAGLDAPEHRSTLPPDLNGASDGVIFAEVAAIPGEY